MNPLNQTHRNGSRPPVYPICQIGNGEIIMMPKPNAKTLAADIAFYRNNGITHLVSLLRQPEMEALQLLDEEPLSRQAGMQFLHFPIKDMDVPDFDSLQKFNRQLLPQIEQGAKVAIHCHGGRGRAGTVAVSLMLEAGIELSQALQTAREKRQDPLVPVCQLQNDFLKRYAQELAEPR
ncbi:dual specificity protein phosphatase family protein [Thiomicrorhabdus sp. 6S3-12]|uniref:protein-tyrosine phosphatase family protein n=1 Tax=Thiomicrorhabdus sp. 6S3-12 TaxID=2819681 RepID=UPI001AACB924|nr:dual specificity protein phosphatase family protein [Thiomicrorhabdus sp. 6S3-12]MBO1924091.1 dual specificity protein phosphatase family protein [Thiomicrorhabdus sp. 6S3-12]